MFFTSAAFITHVIDDNIRIPNLSSEPVQVSRLQHVAQIRSTDMTNTQLDLHQVTRPVASISNKIGGQFFSDAIKVDPDNQLSKGDCSAFIDLNRSHNNVFNSRFGAYNDPTMIIAEQCLPMLILVQ